MSELMDGQSACVFHRVDDRTITATIDKAVYSRAALLRTCYWHTEKLYIFISAPNHSQYCVRFRSQDGASVDLTTLAQRFLNDLLENELRTQIAAETGNVRDMLVAKALGFPRSA